MLQVIVIKFLKLQITDMYMQIILINLTLTKYDLLVQVGSTNKYFLFFKKIKKILAFAPFSCIIKKDCSQGPLVKRLRRRPFTAKTGVRFSQGSPKSFYLWLGSSAGQNASLSRQRSRVRVPSESIFNLIWGSARVAKGGGL